MKNDSPADKNEKTAFACPQCNGQFMVTPEMLNTRLLCPHCRQEIKAPAEVIETPKVPVPPAKSLPPQKNKFVASKKVTRKAEEEEIPAPAPKKGKIKGEEFKFDDKIQSFVPKGPEPELDQKRLKIYNKNKSGMLTFLLMLGAFAFLSISGVYIYKAVKIPEISDEEIDPGSLLVDNEHKEGGYIHTVEFATNIFNEKVEYQEDDPLLKVLKVPSFEEGDLANAFQTLLDFSNASTVDEQIKYVFAPEDTAGPLKIQNERDKDLADKKPKPVQFMDARLAGSMMVANVAMNDNSTKQAVFIKSQGDIPWRLEWFSWSQYQEMTYDELLEKRPTYPVQVRVFMGISADYEKPFEAEPRETNYLKRIYTNVELTFAPLKRLRGYVDRHDMLAADLTQRLMLGTATGTVSIKFPAPRSGARQDQVIIVKYDWPGWMGEKAYEMNKDILSSTGKSTVVH